MEKIKRVTKRERITKAVMKGAFAVFIASALGTFVVSNIPDEQFSGDKGDIVSSEETITSEEIEEGKESYVEITDTLKEEEVESEMAYDFDELKKEYPDMVGVLEGPCLSQPYIVVADSIEGGKYLKHLPNGEYNKIGSVCFSEENNPDLTDDFSALYAHNNLEGAMFDNLIEYYSDEENMEVPFKYYTEYGEYELVPFAFGYSAEIAYGNFDDSDKMSIINAMEESSLVHQNVEIGPDDNVISLFTCPNYGDPRRDNPNVRAVLSCKIKPLVLYNTDSLNEVKTL